VAKGKGKKKGEKKRKKGGKHFEAYHKEFESKQAPWLWKQKGGKKKEGRKRGQTELLLDFRGSVKEGRKDRGKEGKKKRGRFL